jgi:uncharacterized protein
MRNWSIAVAVLTAALAGPAAAQEAEGTWNGILNIPEANLTLKVVMHIKKTADGYTVTGDSPDQNAFGMAGRLVQPGPNLKLAFDGIDGTYEGKWDDAKKAFVGQWTQTGLTSKLDLTKEAPKP